MGRGMRLALAVSGTIVLALLVVALRGRAAGARYATAGVDRGDIVDLVGATGVLQAVTTVQVGSQVSGNILSLGADFNSIVRRRQVIARLDPSLFEARVAQMRATLASALAGSDRSRAAVEDARQKYERAKELAAQDLVPESDLETAKANYDSAVAQLKASEAAVEQARANLNQAEVDLAHTVISAPIDGVVIARNVDVGQTVAASFQAPVLFVIANDMKRMQVNASIDEADIGRVRSGQDVTFRVDAYPDRTFRGKVTQVRLQPITNQNVVTYNTIIEVSNDDLRLMPGMTATVSVIVQSRPSVLRLPTAALRFRPEGFEERGPRGAGGGTRETRGPRPGGSSAEASEARAPTSRAGDGSGRVGLVFLLDERGRPRPGRVRLGISDGRFVEVLDGLEAGALVVTGAEGAAANAPRTAASPASNPFAPGRFQPRSR